MPRLCVEARGSKRQPHTVIYFVRLAKSDPPYKLSGVLSYKLHCISTADAAGWEGLGALYYKLGAAVLVWDAERCEERLAAQIAGASNTSDSGALSGQGGDPK